MKFFNADSALLKFTKAFFVKNITRMIIKTLHMRYEINKIPNKNKIKLL